MAKKDTDVDDVEEVEEPVDETAPESELGAEGDQGLVSGDEGVVTDPSSGRLELESVQQAPLATASATAAATSKPWDQEEQQQITNGTWVRLGGLEGDLEKYNGHEASVVEAPMYPCPGCDFSAQPHMHQPMDAIFLVKTRDQDSALISATREDFTEISYTGRAGLTSAG